MSSNSASQTTAMVSPATPPPLPRRTSSHQRLHLPAHPQAPPVPPRLVGSPLLQKITSTFPGVKKAQFDMWIDGDEFGTHSNNSSPVRAPVVEEKRRVRRSAPSARARSCPPTTSRRMSLKSNFVRQSSPAFPA